MKPMDFIRKTIGFLLLFTLVIGLCWLDAGGKRERLAKEREKEALRQRYGFKIIPGDSIRILCRGDFIMCLIQQKDIPQKRIPEMITLSHMRLGRNAAVVPIPREYASAGAYRLLVAVREAKQDTLTVLSDTELYFNGYKLREP